MEMEKSEIKKWLEENKVCIVTNSITTLPGSLFLHSVKTYIDYIPENNFMVIPGIYDNGKPKYGLTAYIEMINVLTSNQYNNVFDYAIYIDEDCFIKRFDLLIEEFKKFISGNYCLAGLPDGGMICHRNCSRILVNTFLSFWNIKSIRENHSSFANAYHALSSTDKSYKAFMEKLNKVDNGDFYKEIDNASKEILKKCTTYRIKNFKHDPPHANVVRDDPSNPWDQHQVPYSYRTVDNNMEPYYLIEESIVLSTKLPIYYLYGSDLYTNEETNMDNSGITTVIMSEQNEHIAYHTWFARYYKPFSTNIEEVKKHVNRINSVMTNI